MIDREYQREILEELVEIYPENKRYTFSDCLVSGRGDFAKYRKALANFTYLMEHGVIEMNAKKSMTLDATISAKATYKGIDFLREDGGLSAIFGTLTIKFHDDTLRAILQMKVTQSDSSPEDKNRWISVLQSLPSEGIKHLTMTLLDKGIEYLPQALDLIGTGIFP